jgi:hypothetical protein
MNEERVEESLAGRGVGRKKYHCFSHVFLAESGAPDTPPRLFTKSLTARLASRFRLLIPL